MKRKATASKLETWQTEDAGRLRALLDKARKASNWPGQDAFAERTIGKSGSYLTQISTAYRPINIEHLPALARALGVEVREISPTLAERIAAMGSPREPAGGKNRTDLPQGPDGPNKLTLHGMQITTEEIEVGIEWGKLEEPTKSEWRRMLQTLVSSQIRQQRATKKQQKSVQQDELPKRH